MVRRPAALRRIRPFAPDDMEAVLEIWLQASIQAHGFVDRGFWESGLEAMRTIYLPASDTYVSVEGGSIRGFFSLDGDRLAALFVSPDCQGRGIGRELIDKAKSLRARLALGVYRENTGGVNFYRKCGFVASAERVDEHTGHIEILMEYPS